MRSASLCSNIGQPSNRRSYAAGSNPRPRVFAERRGSRACANCDKTSREAEAEATSVFLLPRPRRLPFFGRRCSAASRSAGWRRRGVIAAINRAPAASGAELRPCDMAVATASLRCKRKKERKQTTQGRDGRTVHRHHTGILRRGECGASRHLPLGVCLFLSLFAVCRRFSLQPSCHPAVFLLSSFSLLSLLPLSLRSPLPRSAAPPPPVGPLLSRLLLPLGAVPLSSLRIVAPQVYQAHLSRERLF